MRVVKGEIQGKRSDMRQRGPNAFRKFDLVFSRCWCNDTGRQPAVANKLIDLHSLAEDEQEQFILSPEKGRTAKSYHFESFAWHFSARGVNQVGLYRRLDFL